MNPDAALHGHRRRLLQFGSMTALPLSLGATGEYLDDSSMDASESKKDSISHEAQLDGPAATRGKGA